MAPSDGNGNHTLPGGYLGVTGTTIETSQHNPPLEDISASLTARLMRSGAGGMTGQLKLTDGTVSAPSMTFGSATNWGFYKTSTGIGLAINGVFVAELGGVPTGAVVPFAGVTAPGGFLLAYGQNVNRADYPTLFTALSKTAVGNTNTNTTLNGLTSDLRGLGLEGAYIEGTNIPTGTTIISVDSAASMTLSQAATGSGTGDTFTILPHGQGNGSTTFTIPDYRGFALFGRDDMGGTAASRITSGGSSINGKSLAGSGGAETVTLAKTNLPADIGTATTNITNGVNVVHSTSLQAATAGSDTVSLAPGGASSISTITASTTLVGGSGTAVNKMPPARVSNYIIKT